RCGGNSLHERRRLDRRAADAEKAQDHRRAFAIPQLRGAQARAEILERLAARGRVLAHAHERCQRTTLVLADRWKVDDLRHRLTKVTRTPCPVRAPGYELLASERRGVLAS